MKVTSPRSSILGPVEIDFALDVSTTHWLPCRASKMRIGVSGQPQLAVSICSSCSRNVNIDESVQ
jgi:hypothetical protein